MQRTERVATGVVLVVRRLETGDGIAVGELPRATIAKETTTVTTTRFMRRGFEMSIPLGRLYIGFAA